MNAVPASVAGVERIAMVTPPGRLEPAVLAAAQEAGVSEIWRVGGAQACAALAYGAGPIRPVDKIVGPGNAYVTAAKRRLYGMVGIDALAGPSEIVVVADAAERPGLDRRRPALPGRARPGRPIDPDHRRCRPSPTAVEAAIGGQLSTLATARDRQRLLARPRRGGDRAAGRRRRPWWTGSRPSTWSSRWPIPSRWPRAIRHAGAIFLGRYAPEAIGDYVAGSNHVLPTSRAARFSSGLSVFDFLKRTSIIKCDAAAFAAPGAGTAALAEAEGLPAHARSASIRLNRRLGAAG